MEGNSSVDYVKKGDLTKLERNIGIRGAVSDTGQIWRELLDGADSMSPVHFSLHFARFYQLDGPSLSAKDCEYGEMGGKKVKRKSSHSSTKIIIELGD